MVEQPCLLDHMEVELVDIDLFSAVSFSQEKEMFSYKRQVEYGCIFTCNDNEIRLIWIKENLLNCTIMQIFISFILAAFSLFDIQIKYI